MQPTPRWLATGDLGELDASGALRVIGRQRRMINNGGFKFAPGEIERVLRKDPDVVDARVVAIPHTRLGEVAKAFIVLPAGYSPRSPSHWLVDA